MTFNFPGNKPSVRSPSPEILWKEKLRWVIAKITGCAEAREHRQESLESQIWEDVEISEVQDEYKEDDLAASSCQNPKPEWMIEIKQEVTKIPPMEQGSYWLQHSIYEVPRNLRELDPKLYDPKIVSIGPYHRDRPHLKAMEGHKQRFLRRILKRTEHNVEDYLTAVSDLEDRTRRCYVKNFQNMDTGEFVKMMLLDACFILEILRASASAKEFKRCGYFKGDPIFKARGVLPCIQRDLLKLENQIPLFVLRKLFKLTCRPDETGSVTQLALQFFNSLVPGCHTQDRDIEKLERKGVHLLHVFRLSLLPSLDISDKHGSKIQPQAQPMIHSVSRLRDSGIKLRKRKSGRFMDIQFKKNGILEIPNLVIHDSTESIFLNLMAFEQCYPYCRNHVTSYVNFMDRLINCAADVEYLHHEGIVDHRLGSEEAVSELFNRLCREIAFDVNNCYLSSVTTNVNKYMKRRWPRWRASLNHEYFRHPWAILSLIAAITLIILTFLQTFYTIFGYHYPK